MFLMETNHLIRMGHQDLQGPLGHQDHQDYLLFADPREIL